MNLLSTATQAFFVFASCCTPAAAVSAQELQPPLGAKSAPPAGAATAPAKA